MREAKVFYKDKFVGYLKEKDEGYSFKYDEAYLNDNAKSISLLLPLRKEEYFSAVLFPFFDGLIPEGYLYNLAIKKWKIDYIDRFGVLLKTSKDSIGAVSLEEVI